MTKNIGSVLAVLISLSASNAYSVSLSRLLSSFTCKSVKLAVPFRLYSSVLSDKEEAALLLSAALLDKNKTKIYHFLDRYPHLYKGNDKLIEKLLEYADEVGDDFLRFHVEVVVKSGKCLVHSTLPLKFSSYDELNENLEDAIATNDGFTVAQIIKFNIADLKKYQLGDKILYFAVDQNHFIFAFFALSYLAANPNSLHERRLENGNPSIITPFFLALERENKEISKLLMEYLEGDFSNKE